MTRWTRDQLLRALNLYHQTPFGKQHSTHPPIVALAGEIDRTPSAVAMKLSNFTYLDPAEGGKGLSGASQADKKIWAEFDGNLKALADESEPLVFNPTDAPPPPTESLSMTKQRRRQSFFRKAVLGSYSNRCCISGLSEPSLLRASHIRPWSKSEEHRLNPRNGLCLAGTYDLAFDQFLISFDDELNLIVGDQLRARQSNPAIHEAFITKIGSPLILPDKNTPELELIRWHRGQLL